MASVSIGRSRLPPDEIRWLATSGIMATSEPVRARMVGVDPLHVGRHQSVQPIQRAGMRAFKGEDDGQNASPGSCEQRA